MTTSSAAEIFGGTAPVGAIAQGQLAANSNYLPCDGADYLKASYPTLDTTLLDTYGSNTLTARTMPRSGRSAVAAGNGLMVVLIHGGTSYATSADGGATWVTRTFPTTIQVGAQSIAFGNGVFVATFNNTTGVYTSTDGIAWTVRTVPTGASAWQKVRFEGGVFFLFGGQSQSSATFATSTDGISWTLRTAAFVNPWDVAFSGGLWVLVHAMNASNTTHSTISVSADVVNWLATQIYNASSGAQITWLWEAVAFFAGQWLVMTSNGLIYASRDLANFSLLGTPLGLGSFASMRVLNGRLVLVPKNTYAPVAMTVDLLNYKALANTHTEGCDSVAYGSGSLVLGNLTGTTAVVTTLATDTTKFRTPLMLKVGDGDRYYIRVK